MINRRTIASMAGAATLALAVASWGPALATEPPASSGAGLVVPAMVVGSSRPANPPYQVPRVSGSPGQTAAATQIKTPAPAVTASPGSVDTASPETVDTASPETVDTASPETTESPSPSASASQSPEPGSPAHSAVDSPIPLVLAGILGLGLLAGILTFVVLSWRRPRS